jgi:hypothetical protein
MCSLYEGDFCVSILWTGIIFINTAHTSFHLGAMKDGILLVADMHRLHGSMGTIMLGVGISINLKKLSRDV